MRKLWLFKFFLLIFCSLSCEKKESTSLYIDKLSGYAQKGPYLNGSSISIAELSNEFVPTGKIFTSQTFDNSGAFEVNNVELITSYIELEADGFYFNEVKNESSQARLTLSSLSDLTERANLNANVLTNLEKNRVLFLISNGSTFKDAKKQAQTEILKIFEIKKSNLEDSEDLDIVQEGEDNAILLAISLILQGNLSVAELSELLANISADLREDGEMNSQILGETLINNATLLNLAEIRRNLENRYETFGLEVNIPNFEKYVNQFINSTDYEPTNTISYPETGKTGANILSKDQEFYEGISYPKDGYINSMVAIAPDINDIAVKIYFNKLDTWAIDPSRSGWEKTETIRGVPFMFKFEKDFTKDTLDLKIRLVNSGSATIEIFENGSVEPTRTKNISWSD